MAEPVRVSYLAATAAGSSANADDPASDEAEVSCRKPTIAGCPPSRA